MSHVDNATRVRVVAVASIGFVCAVAALGSGPALAKSMHKPKHVASAPVAANLPVVPDSQYLALGDSVTFGYMEPTVVPAPNYANAAAFPGYPEQLGARLRLSVANAACPGETSASLINASAPSNGCESNPAHISADNYRIHPLHVRYKGSQLAFALSYLHRHHNVRLITLMVQDTAAKPFDVKIADGYGELQAASAHSGDNTCTAGLLTQLSTGGCGIHPSYAGQALLAQALEKAITIG